MTPAFADRGVKIAVGVKQSLRATGNLIEVSQV